MRMLIAAAALALSGCATQVMEGYIGQPVEQVMVERGAPHMILDMPDGRRAFQWVVTSSMVTPTQTYGNANIYAPPGAFANVNYNRTTTGGQTIEQTCRYTLYGRFNAEARTWVVESFEKPSLMCM